MATKAELEAEIAELRREMKQRDQEVQAEKAEIAAAKDAIQPPETEGLRALLDEHGITADTFGENLLEQLTELQKEKPLVVLVAALALGIIVGRAFK